MQNFAAGIAQQTGIRAVLARFRFQAFVQVTVKKDGVIGVLQQVSVGFDAIGDVGITQARLIEPTAQRAGLERAALDSILRIQPGQIAYVSCDPSTLARDAARLVAGGYRLVDVTPFDLFPQTYHIETISLFEKSNEG